jgi:hypothetical protein
MTKLMSAKSPDTEEVVGFEGTVYFCDKCAGAMVSLYSGHYCTCPCGESAVDETEHYTRLIGYVRRDDDSPK